MREKVGKPCFWGPEQTVSCAVGLDFKVDMMKMLAELRREREQIEEAIITLERVGRGRGKRRGRPPAWMTNITRRGPGSKNKPKDA